MPTALKASYYVPHPALESCTHEAKADRDHGTGRSHSLSDGNATSRHEQDSVAEPFDHLKEQLSDADPVF